MMDLAVKKIGTLYNNQANKDKKFVPEMIEIQTHDKTVVGNAEAKAVFRFSTKARETFPKPPKDVKKGAESKAGDNKKVLVVSHGDGTMEPTAGAIRMCLDWMSANKMVHGNQKLLPFHVNTSAGELALLDLYSAVQAIGSRPFPRVLENLLKDVITNSDAFSPERVRCYATRLPKSPVLTRLLTACVQNFEDGLYDEACWREIRNVFAEDKYLNGRFNSIVRSRRYAAAAQAHERRMAEGWSRLSREVTGDSDGETTSNNKSKGGSSSAPQHDSMNATTATTAKTATATTSKAEEKDAGNGRGVGGRHVPGA